MENYISLLVASLEHFKFVTEKEAEKLDKELRNSTLPATYKEAKVHIEQIFDKVSGKDS